MQRFKNYEGVVEPYHKLADTSGLFVTGSLSYSNLNIVSVQCLNPQPWEITVYKNQLIAFIDPFEKLDNVEKVNRVKSSNDFYDASIDIPRLPSAESVEVTKAKA